MLLRSARITIRPWQHQDDWTLNQWPPYNDPLEPLWNLSRQSGSVGDWYGGFDLGGQRRTWAVEDLSARLVGRISLREVDPKRSSARLGITFGAPFVGKGLGTEALSIFLDYYFGELGFQMMVLDVAGPNQRAIRCYERLGFRVVGSDWRGATSMFDRRVLSTPRYAHLAPFFRQGAYSLEVQFFDMELHKEKWLSQKGYSRSATG